jgi:Zn-finger nucleic acid-binding protein
MKCPVCNITLLMSEKQGVEIDYCPDYRGIWIDRGRTLHDNSFFLIQGIDYYYKTRFTNQ